MITDYLVCPECGHGLESCGDVLGCLSCGQRFPVREGVPSFVDPSAYWGEIGYREMRQTNEAAIAGSWENAIRWAGLMAAACLIADHTIGETLRAVGQIPGVGQVSLGLYGGSPNGSLNNRLSTELPGEVAAR